MDKTRILGGLMAAGFVLLWGLPRLLAVWFSEPPPTRQRKILALGNAIVSSALGGAVGIGASGWAAAFINGLVEKFVGINPHVSDLVAAVTVAVLIIHLGPPILAKVEAILGKKVEEVTS